MRFVTWEVGGRVQAGVVSAVLDIRSRSKAAVTLRSMIVASSLSPARSRT